MEDIKFISANEKMSADRAAIYGKELLRVAHRHENALTPEIVVEEARSAQSKLHDWFQWDDSLAAREYRLDQARQLCRSIEIEVVSADGKVSQIRGFVNVPIRAEIARSLDDLADDNGDDADAKPEPRMTRAYVPISIARSNERMWMDVLDEAESRLFQWQKRYSSLLAYDGARERLSGVIEQIELLKADAVNASAAAD